MQSWEQGGQHLSWLCLHPLGPPHHLAMALIPTPCIVGMEHLVMESYRKLSFLLPGLFVLPELIAGEEGLSWVPRASAETLALISQTRKPSADSSSAGSRGRGVPPVSRWWPFGAPTESIHSFPWSHIHPIMQLDLAVGAGRSVRHSSAKSNSLPMGTPDQSAGSPPAPMVPQVPHTPSQQSCIEIRNLEEPFIITSCFCPKAVEMGCTSLLLLSTPRPFICLPLQL